MLHDARNLIGTIGLYCDLLSLPGVLKPEHRQYSDELRHLGERSGTLIDRLMRSLLGPGSGEAAGGAEAAGVMGGEFRECAGTRAEGTTGGSRGRVRAVSLRDIVERRSGLLQRVANGHAIEFKFGPAAATPVRIAEEAVERILVNLVRNAAAAQHGYESESEFEDAPGAKAAVGKQAMPGKQRASGKRWGVEAAGKASAGRPGLIRITLGLLGNRVGEAKPWPFQQVRLSVEDAGRGMKAEQVQSLLQGSLEPRGSSHGIGFCVVRELVAATRGEIQVKSAPGAGTRVQIEWPVAAGSAIDSDAAERRQRSGGWDRSSGPPFATERLGGTPRVEDVKSASRIEATC
jgi:signal transduction histidine kinase